MKKVYINIKYKKYTWKHSRDQFERKLKFKAQKRQKERRKHGVHRADVGELEKQRRKHKKYNHVVAPKCFSFVKNPNEVVSFIATLKSHYDAQEKVFIKLHNIIEIDYGAIVVLLSIMVKFKTKGILFNGDFPKDDVCLEMVTKSGFLDELYNSYNHEERYEITSKYPDGIHTHAWRNVDSVLGNEIIKSSSKTIWNETRRCQGVQRTMVELMQNTNNHAEIGKSGEKHWWLSVYHDTKNKKVVFAFVDFGVGIFTNLNNKTSKSKFFNWANKLGKRLQYGDNADLLKMMLQGVLHQTVTGKHYRGKGLPGIYEAFKRNQISNLHVISNDAYCDAEKDKYQKLNQSFSGTFLCWELGEHNESCK